MARVRFFGPARAATGVGVVDAPGGTVGDVVAWTAEHYGGAYAELVLTCQVWVNGEPVERSHPVESDDEVAIIPPVAGG